MLGKLHSSTSQDDYPLEIETKSWCSDVWLTYQTIHQHTLFHCVQLCASHLYTMQFMGNLYSDTYRLLDAIYCATLYPHG